MTTASESDAAQQRVGLQELGRREVAGIKNDARASRPELACLRLRLKPAHPRRGFVQGAWWPHSTQLTTELPPLLAALSMRIGPISVPRGDRRLQPSGGSGLVTSVGAQGLSVSFRNVCGMSERRFRRPPGGVSSLGLHVVWCPKDGRRVLGGRVARRCGELLEQIAGEHGWLIVAREVMPDHGHLFVRVGATDAPASVVGAFTGRSARVLRQEFAQLRRFANVLWSPSYVAGSVGYVSESRVRGYIEHRWDAVMAW